MSFSRKFLAGWLLAAAGTVVRAQNTAPPPSPSTPSQETAPQAQPEPNPPHGTVLFQSHGEPPTPTAVPAETPAETSATATPPTGPELTDAERSALTFRDYFLDARLTPATSHLAMRARVTVRNDGPTPLTRLALQISSTLHWDSATAAGPAFAPGTQPRAVDLHPVNLPVAQHLLETDADHTGKANEVILTLPSPLAPGSSLTLDTFYSGDLPASTARLEAIGATAVQAADSDWDAITSASTALRGFGNVLWYPVASPQLFLGQGAELFQAIGATRLREAAATIHLRLSVEYRGDSPVAAYFCGRRQPLHALSDDSDAPIATGQGIATADFPSEPLGFRSPSLFLVDHPEAPLAPLPGIGSSSSASAPTSDTPAGPAMLAIETDDDSNLPFLGDAAQRIAPLLEDWFGPHPLSALTILDHPGQPFEDGPLLVAPIAALANSTAAPALAHSLTHAWVQTGQPWIDEGLAQFTALLWTEREQGREAALAQLRDLLHPLIIAEPAFSNPAAPAPAPASATPESQGQPLVAATDELYYRRKAAAVWWMLRGIAGDQALRQALALLAAQPLSHESPEAQAQAFEHLLEKTSGKDLAWFFNDWVLHDRGLPDLTLVDVTPRELPAGKGHDTGWLVAVTVRNDGAAAVEVPLIIRSGTFSTTARLRVPGFATISDRVVVEAAPTEVVLNDGSTPEVGSSTHSRILAAPAAPQ